MSDDSGVVISEIAGQQPVEAEGTIDGLPFYFRARGVAWSIGIGGEPIFDPMWYHREPWGHGGSAGQMPDDEVAALIHHAADRYRAHFRSRGMEPPSASAE